MISLTPPGPLCALADTHWRRLLHEAAGRAAGRISAAAALPAAHHLQVRGGAPAAARARPASLLRAL